jgi:tripartite ATP-independent transporter DctM subunit
VPGIDLAAPPSGVQALAPEPRRVRSLASRAEDAAAIAILVALTALPLAEMTSRELTGHSLPGATSAVQYLTLWITFVGAMLAARAERLLALATTTLLSARWQGTVKRAVAFVCVAITGVLVLASVELIAVDVEFGAQAVWGIPVWAVSLVMPVAFAAILARAVQYASARTGDRLVVALGIVIVAAMGLVPEAARSALVAPAGLAILLATALGLPIFAAIGGAALLSCWADLTPLSAVPGESFRLSTSPLLPAIPLFTLGGYILSGGGASRRLLRLFTAVVGWMPGGLAIVVVLLLAFFTPLTGASGITIVALGGLLLPMLASAGYPERTSIGLVTVSGSIGIFIPPSLPVILYAFYADVPLERMFIAGTLPGVLLIVGVAAWAAWRGHRAGARRQPFSGREVLSALWDARWEIAMPALLLGSLLTGLSTLVETAALMVAYTLIVECFVYRDLDPRRDLPSIFVQSATLVGGFMIILGVALALTNWLTLAQVPTRLLGWVQSVITSPLEFLLALNVFLIVVGALMDIYSAIVVVVPLLVPMIVAYGLDPVHVGVVFLANMQLGYLMPPMGENLFLAAYRFDRTLPSIYGSVVPYAAILLALVLVITYWPALSIALLGP